MLDWFKNLSREVFVYLRLHVGCFPVQTPIEDPSDFLMHEILLRPILLYPGSHSYEHVTPMIKISFLLHVLIALGGVSLSGMHRIPSKKHHKLICVWINVQKTYVHMPQWASSRLLWHRVWIEMDDIPFQGL